MHKKTVTALIITCIGLCTIHVQIGEGSDNNTSIFQGEPSTERYILFTPEASKNTYLINDLGEPVHIWESEHLQGLPAYLFDNGNLIRGSSPGINPVFTSGGITGQVEMFDWDGNVIWTFEYSTEAYCLHHDIEPLPNGNILMIAREKKTTAETISQGQKPSLTGTKGLWPDYIIEVQPVGTHEGIIVWEWHVWDHLIQDYDPTKANYGTVKKHPELVDINYKIGISPDWTHINSIDYNEQYDQILLTAREFGEIWVIDHSTTTLEAADHTGGNSGKGGDILYRWGNPQTYHAGSSDDQKLFAHHDAQWIQTGYPGEGNILIFNNGRRPDREYSSVEEITPPVYSNGSYYRKPDSPYGPTNPTWIYTADNPPDFYSYFLGGAHRLPNGNTLICDGHHGLFFEVTPNKKIIWTYENPYPNLGPKYVFKTQCYYLSLVGPDLYCNNNLTWSNVAPGDIVSGSFLIKNVGEDDSFLNWKIESWPDWGIWTFTPSSGDGVTPGSGGVLVNVEVVSPLGGTREFTGEISVVNQDYIEDEAVIPVYLTLVLTPDLEGNGSLEWVTVQPGETLTTTITIQNNGTPGSSLNWQIESWPDWGQWAFTPHMEGNLTGDDDSINITVSIVAPLEEEQNFTGHIKITNTENRSDYCLIPVTLSTTLSSTVNPPHAAFHWVPPLNISTYETVQFIDESTDRDGYITVWNWDFGDGGYAFSQNSTHIYNETGIYEIKLTVIDNNGSRDSETHPLQINNSAPRAYAGPNQIVNTTQVYFNGTGSTDQDGTIIQYTWDLGDGNISTGVMVSHNYTHDGWYTVTLSVTDNDGATHDDQCNITIDTVQPHTQVIFNGTNGHNEWYIGPVTVTLIATDETSGVDNIYYTLNHTIWNRYTDSFTLSQDGIYTICFYSMDNAGNRENQTLKRIKIDTIPPSLCIVKPQNNFLYIFDRNILYIPWGTMIIGKITLDVQSSDALSGIDRVEFFVDHELRYQDTSKPYMWVYNDKAVLFHRHTIQLKAYDAAGFMNETDDLAIWIFNI